MSETHRFMMGEYEASIPADLHFAKNHMWARRVDEGGWGQAQRSPRPIHV